MCYYIHIIGWVRVITEVQSSCAHEAIIERALYNSDLDEDNMQISHSFSVYLRPGTTRNSLLKYRTRSN